MKKLLTLFISLIVFANAIGKQVNQTLAKRVAVNYLQFVSNETAIPDAASLQLVFTATYKSPGNSSFIDGGSLFYIYSVPSKSFIIVAGDDKVAPILGYSQEGGFNPDSIPSNLAKWLEGYKDQIRFAINKQLPESPEVLTLWTALSDDDLSTVPLKGGSSIAPLVKTKWNQLPYYNALCPGGSVTGCVATAMAQVMKYWNYPVTGSGFHSYNHKKYGTLSANFGSTTYDWASMPNTVNSANSAVATLMYHCGVSVDMEYSPGGSGAMLMNASDSVDAETAFWKYFGYKQTLSGEYKDDYSNAEWISLIRSELQANRPVLYAGRGADGGGHAFVCDGVDGSNNFHFNWGWGGSCDGYYALNAMKPEEPGAGGGNGTYNDDQRAIIRIEPPAQSGSFNMVLRDYVVAAANPINYGDSFTVTTNIANKGTADYTGDYCAALFDDQNIFVDYVEIKTGYALAAGYRYTNNLVFTCSGLLTLLPGKFHIGMYYRPTGENWVMLGDNGSYVNWIDFEVKNPNPIALNSDIVVTPGTTLTHGEPASFNLNIRNDGTTTFYGSYAVVVYDLEGEFIEIIGIIDESNGLPSKYTYLSPYLTFTTESLEVDPGTYLVAVQHQSTNGEWELTGSDYFQNPIKITIIEKALIPDVYENNNTAGNSYKLPLAFNGSISLANTPGANIHISTDDDYYRFDFPIGYDYNVTVSLSDCYSEYLGDYTLDGLFSYSYDGEYWSETFDDFMDYDILAYGGESVYIKVSAYFEGDTGTYSLNTSTVKVPAAGVNDIEIPDKVRIYPNPATDFINIDLSEFSGQPKRVSIRTSSGTLVYDNFSESEMSSVMRVPLSGLAKGIYFVSLTTTEGVINRKIVITN